MTLHSHVEQLARREGIAVDWRTRTSGRAWRRSRRVRLEIIAGRVMEERYALALHELGHILGEQPKTRIAREVAAWQWAKAHAIQWTPKMARKRRACLRNYLRWAEGAQHRQHGRPVLPLKGDPFWALVGQP